MFMPITLVDRTSLLSFIDLNSVWCTWFMNKIRFPFWQKIAGSSTVLLRSIEHGLGCLKNQYILLHSLLLRTCFLTWIIFTCSCSSWTVLTSNEMHNYIHSNKLIEAWWWRIGWWRSRLASTLHYHCFSFSDGPRQTSKERPRDGYSASTSSERSCRRSRRRSAHPHANLSRADRLPPSGHIGCSLGLLHHRLANSLLPLSNHPRLPFPTMEASSGTLDLLHCVLLLDWRVHHTHDVDDYNNRWVMLPQVA